MNGVKGKKIEDKKLPPKPPGKWIFWIILILGTMYLFHIGTLTKEGLPKEISYSQFYSLVENNRQTRQIKSVVRIENIIKGEFIDGTKFIVNIPTEDPDLMKLIRENVADFAIKPHVRYW
jgi:ATP-dependent Zn protease